MDVPAPETVLHATCVADAEGRGLLILGPSGSGKSGLALQLMALGARLVADDRTIVTDAGDHLAASCPAATRGLIEARGVGLLRAGVLREARVVLAVDLAMREADRLPPRRKIVFLGHEVDLVRGPVTAHFPAALMLYLSGGRQE